MSDRVNILTKVEEYILDILTKNLSSQMTYHTVDHTKDVVKSVVEIASKQEVQEGDLEILQIAAWFHDAGYSEGRENHEKSGAQMARDFLEKYEWSSESIDKIERCIMATQMPQNPKNDLEQIICDADMLHLGSEEYFKKSELLHTEIERTQACKISKHEWLQMNYDFLKKHRFFTKYAQEKYAPSVKENLKKINQKLTSKNE